MWQCYRFDAASKNFFEVREYPPNAQNIVDEENDTGKISNSNIKNRLPEGT